jgi:hypothetical protein
MGSLFPLDQAIINKNFSDLNPGDKVFLNNISFDISNYDGAQYFSNICWIIE